MDSDFRRSDRSIPQPPKKKRYPPETVTVVVKSRCGARAALTAHSADANMHAAAGCELVNPVACRRRNGKSSANSPECPARATAKPPCAHPVTPWPTNPSGNLPTTPNAAEPSHAVSTTGFVSVVALAVAGDILTPYIIGNNKLASLTVAVVCLTVAVVCLAVAVVCWEVCLLQRQDRAPRRTIKPPAAGGGYHGPRQAQSAPPHTRVNQYASIRAPQARTPARRPRGSVSD